MSTDFDALKNFLLDEDFFTGGGVITNYRTGGAEVAFLVSDVDQYTDDWIAAIGPWSARRENDQSPWLFWDNYGYFDLGSTLSSLKNTKEDADFRVWVADVSPEGPAILSIRHSSTRSPEVNDIFITLYKKGHFTLSPEIVEGFPEDLGDLTSCGYPVIDLSDKEWFSLIGAGERDEEDYPALPICCADVSYLRDRLESIHGAGNIVTPRMQHDTLQAIQWVTEEHEFDWSTILKIRDQLLPTLANTSSEESP